MSKKLHRCAVCNKPLFSKHDYYQESYYRIGVSEHLCERCVYWAESILEEEYN